MTVALLALLLLAADAPVALRAGARPVTEAQAAAMTPAALADALLAPGHPPIVERIMPDVPLPPPPGYVAPLDVQLVGAATLDRAAGFCVKHRWRVTGTPAGVATAIVPAATLYRWPPVSGGCEGESGSYFAVDPADSPRAFTIVRLLAQAVADPKRFGGKAFVVHGRTRTSVAVPRLPLDRLFAVRRTIISPLIDKADLTAPDGRSRENWELLAMDPPGASIWKMWTIHLTLDGDRIATLAMAHAVPAPF